MCSWVQTPRHIPPKTQWALGVNPTKKHPKQSVSCSTSSDICYRGLSFQKTVEKLQICVYSILWWAKYSTVCLFYMFSCVSVFPGFRQSSREASTASQVQPFPLTPVRYRLQNFQLSRLFVWSPVICCVWFDRLLFVILSLIGIAFSSCWSFIDLLDLNFLWKVSGSNLYKEAVVRQTGVQNWGIYRTSSITQVAIPMKY